MGLLSDITRLSLELVRIDKEKAILYAKEKEIKEELRHVQDLLIEKCRNGQTIEDLEERDD